MTKTVALVSTTFAHVPQNYQGSRLEEEPLDLMYIAALTDEEVAFRICLLEVPEDRDFLAAADGIIFSTTNSYLQWNNHPMGLDLFLSTWAEVVALAPVGAFTVVIGPHVPGHHRRISELGASVVLLGEAELEAARVARSLLSGTFSRDAFEGVVDSNAARLPLPVTVTDLDALPTPAYSQTVRKVYNAHNHPTSAAGGHLYEASRGCPYQCSFCNTITHRQAYRMKSPAIIRRDLAEIARVSPRDYVYFIDESFGFNRRWANEIFDVLADFPLTYGCQGNLSFSSVEKLDRMAEVGFVNIEFGYETANEGVIKGIGKNNAIQKAPDLINHACELGLSPILFTQIGLPGETRDTLRENVAFMRQLDPRTRISIAMTTPYFDTSLWRDGVSSGLIPIDARGDDLYAFTGRVNHSLTFEPDRALSFLARFGPNNYLTAEFLDELDDAVQGLFAVGTP